MNLVVCEKEWHGVEIEETLPEHIVIWLDARVGKESWFAKGNIGGQTVYFDTEKNHLLFLMTWAK